MKVTGVVPVKDRSKRLPEVRYACNLEQKLSSC
jgi:hypothetical protein